MFTVIIVLSALGFIGGCVVWDVLVADPLRKRCDSLHGQQFARQMRDLREAHEYKQHRGTPYIARKREQTMPTLVATGLNPGFRIVEGHRLYSAEWLNDDAKVNP